MQKLLHPTEATAWRDIVDILGLPLETGDEREENRREASSSRNYNQFRCDEQFEQKADWLLDIDGRILFDDESGQDSREKPHQEQGLNDGLRNDMQSSLSIAPDSDLEIEQTDSNQSPPSWYDPRQTIADFEGDTFVELEAKLGLLHPDQRRSLLTAMATSQEETGEINEERIVDDIANGQALERIPYRLRSTSRFGVQLLLDRGRRLQPLRQDQRLLLTDLRRIVGAYRIDVQYFSSFPDLTGPGAPRTWQQYKPPAAGTVVLAITDMGLGWLGMLERRGDENQWIAWANAVRSAGAYPVLLVAHGDKYWVDAMRRCMAVVHWDRHTSVGSVRAAQQFSAFRRR